MLVLSDRLPCVSGATNGETSVFKPAIVPQSVRVSNVRDGRALVVQQGGISILITLAPEEARVIGEALCAGARGENSPSFETEIVNAAREVSLP